MSASITVSEKDFEVLQGAAIDAALRGDHEEARRLDTLARKANAALAHANLPPDPYHGKPKRVRWQDVPSVFEGLKVLEQIRAEAAGPATPTPEPR